jgi:hypothetical protein
MIEGWAREAKEEVQLRGSLIYIFFRGAVIREVFLSKGNELKLGIS